MNTFIHFFYLLWWHMELLGMLLIWSWTIISHHLRIKNINRMLFQWNIRNKNKSNQFIPVVDLDDAVVDVPFAFVAAYDVVAIAKLEFQ